MKAFCKKPAVGMLLLMLTLVWGFSSCGDDAMWTESRLVGIWHTRDNYGNSYTQVKFFEDGTGMIEQYDYGRLSDYSRFSWEANRHRIYFDYYDRSPEYWEIDFEGRNAFRLYFDDGDYTYFVRDY